ncbi:MAG TPA: YdhR family protein [Vicinamibacterales bacterium]|nr:YdhR family protein [Vicinamibacterales bacterium]
MPKVLQLNFKLNIPASEWEATAETLAPMFVDIPGLRWKVWMLNEVEGEAGGIYLFESAEKLDDFLNGPIPVQIKSAPFLRDLSVKVFDVMTHVTALTRGPVDVIQMPKPEAV